MESDLEPIASKLFEDMRFRSTMMALVRKDEFSSFVVHYNTLFCSDMEEHLPEPPQEKSKHEKVHALRESPRHHLTPSASHSNGPSSQRKRPSPPDDSSEEEDPPTLRKRR